MNEQFILVIKYIYFHEKSPAKCDAFEEIRKTKSPINEKNTLPNEISPMRIAIRKIRFKKCFHALDLLLTALIFIIFITTTKIN